ncbi:MAG: hypothetical protein U0289_02555 [Cyclobacteriaceae bacterium]|jgi:hypothetical protein|nr:hypothetical protein [Cytophagales bacterium]HNP76400.1 hypothetical protein [Cyclobacteriaceae bacterium]
MIRFGWMTVIVAGLMVAAVSLGVTLTWFERPGYFEAIIFFVGLATLITYGFTSRKVLEAPEDFIRIYMTATVVRIMLFGAGVGLMVYLDTDGATANAILFLVAYLLFTILEVAVLWQEANAKKSPERGQKDR